MLPLVEQWQQSGMSQRAFCQQHHLKVSTFGYWVGRSKQSQACPGGFSPIDVSGASAGQQVEIIYPNGVKLAVGTQDLRLIGQLIGLG